MRDLFSKISSTEKSSPLQYIQNFWIRVRKIQEDFRKNNEGNKKPHELSDYFFIFSKQKQIG